MKYYLALILTFLSFINLIGQQDTIPSKSTINLSQEIAFEEELLESGTDQKIEDLRSNDQIKQEHINKMESLFLKLFELSNNNKVFSEFLENGIPKEKFYIKKMLGNESMTDEELKQVMQATWFRKRGDLLFPHWDLLIKILGLHLNEATDQEIAVNLSYIDDHLTLQHLAFWYNKLMRNFKETSSYIISRNKNLIKERLSVVEKKKFVFYRSVFAKPEPLKSLSVHHDNDVLTMGGFNQDREYTGGGEITLTTDLLNTRWINGSWILTLLKRNKTDEPKSILMKYQSISVGAEAYTPYIRYKDYTKLADTLFNRDRPFASVFFVEKTTYRLWPKGLIRHKGQWRVGTIGSHQGNNIQATLHRDAITKSQKVYGWDNQIANGGRLYIQTEQKFDVLLYSNTNEYISAFSRDLKNKGKRVGNTIGANIISTHTLLWGGKISGLESGLRFSTANFTNISGENHLQAIDPNSIYKFAFSFDCGVHYRYVHHNSLLEDFGYLKTIKDDEFDDEAISSYFFNKEQFQAQPDSDDRTYDRLNAKDDQLQRHLFKWDVGINLRFRRSTLFARMIYLTKEYKADKSFNYITEYSDFYNTSDRPEAGTLVDYKDQVNEGFGKEQNDFLKRNFYAYGTVGMVWLIGDN